MVLVDDLVGAPRAHPFWREEMEEQTSLKFGHSRAPKPCEDHKGNKYPSFAAMCRAYCKVPVTVKKHLNNGWSLKDALECQEDSTYFGRTCLDHLGIEYQSEEARAKAYGKSQCCVTYRLNKLGWSLKDALTIPAHKGNKRIVETVTPTQQQGDKPMTDIEQELKEAQMKALNEIAENNAQEQEAKIISCLNATEAKLEHIYEFAQYPHQFTSGEAVEGLLVAINTRSAQPFFCDGDEKAYALIREVK